MTVKLDRPGCTILVTVSGDRENKRHTWLHVLTITFVQSKLSVLSDQLRSKGGGSLRRLFSPGDREDTLSCTRCRTILKHDVRLMEQHAGVRRKN